MHDRYKTSPGAAVDPGEIDSSYTEPGLTKDQGKKRMKDNRKKIADLQDKLYAYDRYSLLIIFQALDAAGKDSTIKHVFKKVRPQGIHFVDFFPPSKEEKQHDYLWRIHKRVPERRMINIFHRSYYEDLTATRVHPEYILEQKIPGIEKIKDIQENFWMERYRQINDFEKLLTENGTVVIKFFLNVSLAEQSKRFLKRLRRTDKHWKFSEKDIEEQSLRKNYINAYRKAINNTSTAYAPWYIIPADKKWFMRYLVSDIILKKLQDLDLKYPELVVGDKEDISRIEKKLKNQIKEQEG